MAKLPPIDLTELLKLLKAEGRCELNAALAGKFGNLTVIHEWENILKGLDEIVPKLAEGTEIIAIKNPVLKLGKSVAALSSIASQVLSFVPGPIGIVCSFVNAIVCLCTIQFPMCIGNAFLELLGCIPGGKVALKGGAKLAPKIEKILLKTFEDNKVLREIIEKAQEIDASVKNFAKKAKINTSKNSTHNAHAGVKHKTDRHRLDIDESTFYGNASSPGSILFEGDQVVRRYQIMPRPITNVGNPLANPWSHLF